MSFKSGVILILLSAAAWGLGGVCGQFFVPVSQRYGTVAYCGAAGAGRVHFFRLSAFARRKYFPYFCG